MYQVLSITTVPEPLSAGFIIMSCRCLSWLMACLSVAVWLSRILLGVPVVMSSLTASKKVSRARSLSVGGFQVLLLWKGVSSLLAFAVLLLSSKKYSVRDRSFFMSVGGLVGFGGGGGHEKKNGTKGGGGGGATKKN